MKLVAARPERFERGPAFVTRTRGCTLEEVRRAVFRVSPSAEKLAAKRKELGVGLRDAASRLRLRAVELSGLEHGRLVPADPADWTTLLAMLQDGDR